MKNRLHNFYCENFNLNNIKVKQYLEDKIQSKKNKKQVNQYYDNLYKEIDSVAVLMSLLDIFKIKIALKKN